MTVSTLNHSAKPLNTYRFFLFFPVVIIANFSCNMYESSENDKSDEARLEKAAILVDDGDYEKAESILNELYNKNPLTTDPYLLQLLSNTVSGKHGINTLSLLDAIKIMKHLDIRGGLDLAGRVLGDNGGVMTRNHLDDMLLDIHTSAIPLLEQIEEKSNDHHTQLGLLSLIDTVLVVGEIIMENQDTTSVAFSTAGFRALYRDMNFGVEADFIDFVTARLGRLNDNAERIGESIDSLVALSAVISPEAHFLAEVLRDFLFEIAPAGRITYASLQDFVCGN